MFPLVIVGGFIFVGVVVLFVIYYSRSMKMTSYTDAEVVRAEERVVRDEKERREETAITAKYSVRGEAYQIEHVVQGMKAKIYPTGRKLTVWYNPNNPNMSKIKD